MVGNKRTGGIFYIYDMKGMVVFRRRRSFDQRLLVIDYKLFVLLKVGRLA